VVCVSQFGPCDEEIHNQLAEFDQLSLYESKKKIESFLKGLSIVDKFEARLLLPNKIKVVLVQKKPIFGLKKDKGKIALVDKQGEVLSYQTSTLLPIINFNTSPPTVGERVDAKSEFALKILEYMNKLFGIKEGFIENESVFFNLASGQKVIFPLSGEPEVLVGSAVLINNRLNKASADTRMEMEPGLGGCDSGCVIDLRFKNPVVKI